MSYHHNNIDASNRPQVAVVMVPLAAQGHLNQLLHLARLISTYNIPIHYVSTPTHNHQVKLRFHGPLAANVHFHDFPIPEFESPVLDPHATNKFPAHFQPLFNTLSHLREPLAAFVRELSQTLHRVIVIHDSMMSSVVRDVASIPNGESFEFPCLPAFPIFWYHRESMEKPFPIEKELEEHVPSLEDCFTTEIMDLVHKEMEYLQLTSGTLFNTCRVTEGRFLDLLEKLPIYKDKKIWAIGPLNPVELPMNTPRHQCLQWLDRQEPKSVVFISFGTMTSLTDEQIKELAIGVEESHLKFIWVLRDADKPDFNATDSVNRQTGLPLGFEDRVSDRGIVVRDWAPQLEILGHPSTGGFVTHCGWNSCMESMSMGVPVVAWPMHSDQPRNAVLLTKVLRVGIAIKDWAERGKVVTSTKILKCLRSLMVDEQGEGIRRREEELGGVIRAATMEDGASRVEMESFITYITRE